MSRRFRHKLGHRFQALLLAMTFAISLGAQPDQDEPAAAQALFERGRALMQEGRVAEACAKFEESNRLDPGIGTQFNLAACYEELGRFASAYALFTEVAAVTRQAGQQDRERVARERAAALKPKLDQLTIVVPDASRVPGLEVRRGGITVGSAQWGVPIPVDPGSYEVIASASGYRSWKAKVSIAPNSKATTLEIPVLRLEVSAPDSGAAALDEESKRTQPTAEQDFLDSPWNVATVSLATVGVLSLGAGAFFGLRAMSLEDDSEELGCVGNTCPTQASFDKRREAADAGDLATFGVVGGLVALAGAGVMFWVVPDTDHNSELTLTTSSDAAGAALHYRGTF